LKVLFISHDAKRTGAPILLIRLIREVIALGGIETVVLLKQGGPMESAFADLTETHLWEKDFPPGIAMWADRIFRKFRLNAFTRQAIYRQRLLKKIADADIIFSNTATNVALLKQLPIGNKKVFTYIHELWLMTRWMAGEKDIEFLQNVSTKIFVPCLAVKNFLVNQYGMRDEKVEFLRYIIPSEEKPEQSGKKEIAAEFPQGKFLVGHCGTLDWRKGFDLFLLLARKLMIERKIKDLHFVWIGVDRKDPAYQMLETELEKMQLCHSFTCIDSTPHAARYLSQLDVLTLTSREDAFPLVVLEAAGFGVPTVCFEGAGGIPEFTGQDAGVAVPYLDIDAMASAVVTLQSDPEKRKALGAAAKERLNLYRDGRKIAEQLVSHF
jgi:glycosyltransferase involved in cell wall biosynthesis